MRVPIKKGFGGAPEGGGGGSGPATDITGAAGLAADPQYSREVVIFDPSIGASAGNIYKTYAEVDAALVALAGYPTELRFVGACPIPAGGPYRTAGVHWDHYSASPSTVTIADGASFTGCPASIAPQLTVQSNATSSPFTAGAGLSIVFAGEASTFKSSVSTPMISAPAGSIVALFAASGATYGDGTNPVINAAASGVSVIFSGFGTGPTLKDNAIAGVAGSNFLYDTNNAGANISVTHSGFSGNIVRQSNGGGAALIALDDSLLDLTGTDVQAGFAALFDGSLERLRLSSSSGAPGTPLEGDFWYDDAAQTIAVQTGVTGAGGVRIQLGQEVVALGTNKTGAQIDNGDLVYVDGAQGNRPTIAKYIADGTMEDDITIGFATHDIADDATGFVTTFGLVRDLDTSAYSEGDKLYASPSTAGEWTDTPPVAPQDRVMVGYVTVSHVSQGVIFARVQFMETEQHHLTTASSNPAAGTTELIGHYGTIASGQAISDVSPYTAGTEYCNSQAVINATAISGALTLRITGDSVDEATGAITPSDTEDIAISSTGWYSPTKKWIGTPQFGITTAAASGTFSIYKTRYWDDKNRDFRVTGLRFEFTPNAANWSATYTLYRLESDGQLTPVQSKAFASTDSPKWADSGEKGTWKLGGLTDDFEGSGAEGMILEVSNVSSIRYIYSDIEYTHI